MFKNESKSISSSSTNQSKSSSGSITNKQLFKHRSMSSSTKKLLNNLPMSRFSGTNKKLLKNLSKSGVSTSKRVVKKSTKL